MINKILFKRTLKESGLNYKKLAEKIHMSPSTLYKRIADGNFRVTEINEMTKILPVESVEEIFFPEYYSRKGDKRA